MQTITPAAKKALLSESTSRQNKLWLITGWIHFRKWYIEWKWAGEPYNSRMLFMFEPNGIWIEAKSFDEDMLPKYKYGKEK
jgi:hypothetical protein